MRNSKEMHLVRFSSPLLFLTSLTCARLLSCSLIWSVSVAFSDNLFAALFPSSSSCAFSSNSLWRVWIVCFWGERAWAYAYSFAVEKQENKQRCGWCWWAKQNCMQKLQLNHKSGMWAPRAQKGEHRHLFTYVQLLANTWYWHCFGMCGVWSAQCT